MPGASDETESLGRDRKDDRSAGVGGFHDEIERDVRHHRELNPFSVRGIGGRLQRDFPLGRAAGQQRVAGRRVDRNSFGQRISKY